AMSASSDESIFGVTDSNAIYIDDFSLFTSTSSSIGKYQSVDLGVNVYPIPAGNELNFDNTKVKSGVINIYSSIGQLMHQEYTSTGLTSVNISKYAQGN